MVKDLISTEPTARLDIWRCAFTGSITLMIVFLLCWLAVFLGWPGGHAFLAIFAMATVGPGTAFWMGIACAVMFGGLLGAIVAIAYSFSERFASR